ncbi:MAG: prolyl oligopeptidase family serine peptidase [Phycisphaerae bacterium]
MSMRPVLIVGVSFLAGVGVPSPGAGTLQDSTSPQADEVPTGRWAVIERVGRYGRAPVHTDAIEAEIVAGRWSAPQAGDTVRVSEEVVKTWQEATPDKDGWVGRDALRGGYACMMVETDTERTMLLDAAGHRMAYVNGVPRAGDPYSTGWIQLPVRMQAGTNTFLFHMRRGRVRARLVAPKADVLFNTRDLTLPDVIRSEPVRLWGAIPVINATPETLVNVWVTAVCDGVHTIRTPLPPIPPMSVRKVGFRIVGPPVVESDSVDVQLRLSLVQEGDEKLMDTATLTLDVRGPRDRHKRTFVSDIDGSVQYYAVTPAHPEAGDDSPSALFLTLHGAGVEAIGQARAYSHKSWGHVVAPTNRRPYGFDWEDWGRLDALEVLEIAMQRWNIDPQRIYLTGHSMGGHGVWQVGATFPDRFAAIGPSAAWPEFWSYGGAAEYEDATPIEQILARAVSPSRTLTLSRNYLHYGVYILHGERDDNVPVSLARRMRAHLAEFHTDFAYYERPGAGHWWSNACVDWPPLFDFFKHHTKTAPQGVRRIEFHTASPGVSASSSWVTIEAQMRPLEPSSVEISFDPQTRQFSGTTKNVARLALDLTELSAPREREVKGEAVDATVLPPGEPLTVKLDDQALENIPWPDAEPRIWLRCDGETWTVISRPAPSEKGPHRYGPFKQAFRHRFLFVYGTQGTAVQNAASYNKARYDAETFGYRGNGTVDVIPDVAFDPSKDRDRNVILYGNADTNAAWVALLGESPVQVRRGAVTVGQREITGDDLACLFVRPRPGSDRALVGAVAGTGNTGLRLTERLPYFVSGIAYPDCIVLGPEVLLSGTAGVRVAGFFGIDWGVESGEFAWRK